MIEVKGLTKHFGQIPAVDDITFQVGKGEVLGFLGPNGAGKSTTMKMLTCFLPPTDGTARVGGRDILDEPVAVRDQIGYLPENAPTYGEMTVTEFLRFVGEMRGYRGADLAERIDRVIDLTSLEDVQHQIVETLSKGFRQRTCFAQALLHDPPVLILDEPTEGLDPNQKHEMRELIQRMREEKTIILSTHILEEMEAVCTRAIVIARGRIVADGTPEELAARSRWHNAVTLRTGPEQAEALRDKLKGLGGVDRVRVQAAPDSGPATVTVFPRQHQVILPEVTRLLEQQGVSPEEIFAERGRVDEVFREITGA